MLALKDALLLAIAFKDSERVEDQEAIFKALEEVLLRYTVVPADELYEDLPVSYYRRMVEQSYPDYAQPYAQSYAQPSTLQRSFSQWAPYSSSQGAYASAKPSYDLPELTRVEGDYTIPDIQPIMDQYEIEY